MPFSRYRRETRTLLGAQLVFNLGFYAVIPFLAGAMGDDYGLDAAAVGLVLGARTFSQQGMFLAGGLLADRWGARRAILIGCLVRISGYAALAAASNFSLFLLGAVLTGAGGALFSPALESQLSRADRVTEDAQPEAAEPELPSRRDARRSGGRSSSGWQSPGKSVRWLARCSERPCWGGASMPRWRSASESSVP